MNAFNIEAIETQLKVVESMPPFQPDKYELRYTTTQLFETGIEVSLSFVIRNGEQIFYASSKRREHEI